MSEPLYDVVIYESASRRVETVVGRYMHLRTGFSNAERRLATVRARLDAHYSAAIVPAGLYERGCILLEEEHPHV